MNLFSAKIETEGHILRVNNAIHCSVILVCCNKRTKRVVTTSGIFPSHLDGSVNKECLRYPERYRSTFPFVHGLSTLITQIM